MGNWNSFWTEKNHGSPLHGRPQKKATESKLTAAQTTVMNMKCKHEMVNRSKWFCKNPQTSHHLNCCKHECTTATSKKRKFTICKFQVSQTNCFTFPKKNTKFQLQKLMQTPCANKTQPSLSSLASSQAISSDLTGFKTYSLELSHKISLPELSHRISL